jgi:DNA-binding beta-propeller fold protein YncE
MRRFLISCGIVSCLALSAPAIAQANPPLKLVQTVDLPGYTGDFDHLTVDMGHGRLLVAAEDHATLESFDLKSGKHLQTISGFGAPHTILVRPGASTILVTDSSVQGSKLLNASTLAIERNVKTTLSSADSMGYDPAKNRAYIVTGGKDIKMTTSELAIVDPTKGVQEGGIPINASHVEAMALERHGSRLFINLTDKNTVAVIDRRTKTILTQWKIGVAQVNSPIALDESLHRLFIVCREPGMLVVMNSDTGKVMAYVPAPGIADDIAYDRVAKRVYVPGGVGWIGVYNVSNPDHPKLIARVPSAVGAKTATLAPSLHKLYVAVSPGDHRVGGQLLTFEVFSSGK